jgi:DNA-binding IclR family transcriptional regulator
MPNTSSTKRNKLRSSPNSGLDVLEFLVAQRRSMTLTELSSGLGVSKSSVHHLLSTLSRRGLLQRLPDQRYRIGLKAWEIGCQAAPIEIGRAAAPHMAELVSAISEGCDLGVRDGCHMICMQMIECPQPVRVHARVGDRNPVHCTSTGLALLATLSDLEVEALLPEKLEPVTPDTIADRETLLRELRRTRMRGHAVYLGGWRIDVAGVAVAIRDGSGRAVAGLCVPAPRYRVTRPWLQRIAPTLVATAQRIERDIAGGADGLTSIERQPIKSRGGR